MSGSQNANNQRTLLPPYLPQGNSIGPWELWEAPRPLFNTQSKCVCAKQKGLMQSVVNWIWLNGLRLHTEQNLLTFDLLLVFFTRFQNGRKDAGMVGWSLKNSDNDIHSQQCVFTFNTWFLNCVIRSFSGLLIVEVHC